MDDLTRLREAAEYLAAIGAVAVRRHQAQRTPTVPSWMPHPATTTPSCSGAEALAHNAIHAALDRLKSREREQLGLVLPVDVQWCVDPIGGAHNLTVGLPAYTVSVAAVLDGITLAGAVAEPATGRLWSAALNSGARLLDPRHGPIGSPSAPDPRPTSATPWWASRSAPTPPGGGAKHAWPHAWPPGSATCASSAHRH